MDSAESAQSLGTTSVSCTLTTKQAASRLLEWDQLQSRAEAISPIAGGARFVLGADLAEGVRDLAAREATCCSFLRLYVDETADRVTLDVTTDSGDGRRVIELIAGIAVD